MIVPADQFRHLAGENACAGDAEGRITLVFEDCKDDCIPFNEDLGRVIFQQKLIDRFIEVQAEIGGRIHVTFEQGTGHAG